MSPRARASLPEGSLLRLLDALPTIVWATDERGETTYVNDAWVEYTGTPREHALGASFSDAVHPDDRPETFARWTEAWRGGAASRTEYRLRRADGAYRWFVSEGRPLRDEDGRVTGWVGTCTDIHEHREGDTRLRGLMAQLQASEASTRQVLHDSPVGILVATVDRLLYANPALLDLLGYSEADLAAGLFWTDFTPPEHADADARATAELLADGRATPYEKEYLRRDGTRVPVLVGATLLRGEPDRVVGYVVDLTQRTAARDELERQRALFERIAETTPDILYVVDVREGRNTYANRELTAVLGYTAAEVQALGPALMETLVHPDDLATVYAHQRRLAGARDGEVLSLTYRMRRPSGEFRVLVSHDTVFERDADGAVRSYLGLGHDATNEVRAREALEESEARFRRLADVNPIGVVVGDARGGLEYVNDAYLRLLGETREDFEAGRIDWRAHTPPEWLPADERAVERARAGLPGEPYEKEYRRRDGTRVSVLVSVARFGPEEHDGLVAYVLDLSARKAAEEELRASEARLRDLTQDLEVRVAERTRELDAARRRSDVLARLGDALQRAASPEEVAALALPHLGPALRAQSMLVVRLEGDQLRLPTLWGDTPRVIAAHMTRSGLTLADTPLLRRAAASGAGVYIHDYREEPGTVPGFPALASAVEPILTPGGALAGFVVVWRPPSDGGWRDDERDLARRAALTLGLALERASRARQLEEERAALAAFARFTETSSRTTDIPALARQAADTLRATLGDVRVAYHEHGADGWHALVRTGGARLGPDAPGFARAFETRDGVFVDGTADAPGTGAALHPYFEGDAPRGLLTMETSRNRAWTERERSVFLAVARSLELAFVRAEQTKRLAAQNEELDTRARALQGFSELTRDLALELDPVKLVGRAQDIIVALRPAIVSTYYELEGDTWRLLSHRGEFRNPALLEALGRGLPRGATVNVDRPHDTREAFYQDRYDPGTVAAARDEIAVIRSSAAFPVFEGRRVRGVLVVGVHEPRSWNAADRSLLETVMHNLRLALERAAGVAELAQRSRELARSNAELEQFAYVASHDLQAPIRAMTSFADVLERRHGEQLDERGRAYLRQIVEGGQHMKRLVDDLLRFSRVHTEQRPPEPTDANAVFDAVARRLAPEAEALGARLSRGALPTVLVDAPQFDSLLQNLVQNGLKYRRDGVPPEVRVEAERDGAFWRFAVTDNGIGIEPQYFERIFVIFQRLHPRDRYEGTGIGLAVAKKIVERHGGRLWVESTPGEGSTFRFTLPDAVAPTA